MGRNGHGLCGLEAALHCQRAGVSAVLPGSFVSLQDSSPSGVFRHGITKACFWQNSQAPITRAILGRRATRGCLSSFYETVAFLIRLSCKRLPLLAIINLFHCRWHPEILNPCNRESRKNAS